MLCYALLAMVRIEVLCCILGSVVIVLVLSLSIAKTCMKACPPDKALIVVSKNKDGTFHPSKCLHGGICLVNPFTQICAYLDLTPFPIAVELKDAPSQQGSNVDISSIFTVAVSSDREVLAIAADKLVGLSSSEISDLAQNIIFGQLLLIISSTSADIIDNHRETFLSSVSSRLNGGLNKIGLKLIDMQVTDISVCNVAV